MDSARVSRSPFFVGGLNRFVNQEEEKRRSRAKKKGGARREVRKGKRLGRRSVLFRHVLCFIKKKASCLRRYDNAVLRGRRRTLPV